jgi:hypothetical protein
MRMYKTRIRQWRLDKTYKEAEARAILRIKKLRDAVGKDSIFRVRGKPVTVEKVHRYLKRKGVANPETEAQDPVSTPPDIQYWTPLSSPSPRFKSMQVAKEGTISLRAGLLEGRSAQWSVVPHTIIRDSTQGNDDP